MTHALLSTLKWLSIIAVFLVGLTNPAWSQPRSVVVASKTFTEGRILAELIAQLIENHTDISVERKLGLGGTLICFTALKSGEIDIYADYTGTGWAIILKEEGKITDPLKAFLHVQREFSARYDIEWLSPFGFNNSYALGMRKDRAEALNITQISDLVAHEKSLKAGVSLEFVNREDGYPGLRQAYGLNLSEVRGMEHGLVYEALNAGEIDLIDVYTTDGKLARYPIAVLKDDRQFFPPYDAAPLIRKATLERYPELRSVIEQLAFQIDEATMQKLNNEVETHGKTFADVARDFLNARSLVVKQPSPEEETVARDEASFWTVFSDRRDETLLLTVQHIFLTFVSVLLATLVAVPIGISIRKRPRLRWLALGVAGVVQTIPSLALLAFMIPIPGLGLGVNAAIAALFVYALLPILRNTYTGLKEVDPNLIEAAVGLGLTDRQVLVNIELPLAARTLMAGIRTATVISVGVATLAAFIGAGGLGEPILTGLQLNDTNLILTGAVPAALLALIVDFGLARLERAVIPKGLQLAQTSEQVA